jgi:hypothetical protein
MRKLTVIAVVIFSIACTADAIDWTTLDRPGWTSTQLYDTCGNTIVGVNSPFYTYGTIYNGSMWTTLSRSGATSISLYSIDGSNTAGSYQDSSVGGWHGFIYNLDNSSWTVYDFPGATTTTIYGIDGSRFVGTYNSIHSFFYNGTEWITLDHPQPSRTKLYDVDGDYIVGTNGNAGVIYNLTTQIWTDIHFPYSNNQTYLHGIDGCNIVGYCGEHGFLYNLDTQKWTPLDFPDAASTKIYGIDGLNIVGQYTDSLGNVHGFLATIPEPAAMLFLTFGSLLLRKR